MSRPFVIAMLVITTFSSAICAQQSSKPVDKNHLEEKPSPVDVKTIEALIDQLVFESSRTSGKSVLNPDVRVNSDEYRHRFKNVQDAFQKLSELKAKAFPILVTHLGDKRQSINFRNHSLGNSVGDACKWNIYFQLQDRPRDYSKYGYQRTGKDGKGHLKPYWEGTPFDEAGGIKKWLEENKDLTYPEMQIECLKWLLDRERIIGAPDADSYFVNILPLEIQILKRQKEIGMDVQTVLLRKKAAMKKRDATVVPLDVLPNKGARR